MMIPDFKLRVLFQIFSEPGNKNIQASSFEIVILSPNFYKDIFTFHQVIDILKQQFQ